VQLFSEKTVHLPLVSFPYSSAATRFIPITLHKNNSILNAECSPRPRTSFHENDSMTVSSHRKPGCVVHVMTAVSAMIEKTISVLHKKHKECCSIMQYTMAWTMRHYPQ